MKSILKTLLLLCSMLLLITTAVAEAADWTTLQIGDKGEQVIRLKERLFELGYYQTDNFKQKYSEDTAERVREFQRSNGLPETGIVTEADAVILFSSDAVRAVLPTPKPYATPAPLPEIDMPERDEQGYLTSNEAFLYENDDEGRWIYLNKDLQVMINRRTDSRVPLIWFETEIICRGETSLRSVDADPERPGKKYLYPDDIADNYGLVLAFSDDFYGDRVYHGHTLGIIVRDGKVVSDETYPKRTTSFPNLDVLAQFPDGSLKAYYSNEHTAQEYIDIGAVNTYSFGPLMIRDGEMSPKLLSGHYSSKEPRQALGMIEPGHYLLVTVQGRSKKSEGCDLWHIAGIMLDRGVQEAMNLDGGNTVALVFMGKMLNKPGVWNNKRASIRTLTSMIGIGSR